VRALALTFDANWDLLTERVPWSAQDTEPPPVAVAGYGRGPADDTPGWRAAVTYA
jgi:hypothetical protein